MCNVAYIYTLSCWVSAQEGGRNLSCEDPMTAPMWRRLADDLAHEIRSGQREPGSRLPSYVELAEKGYAQSTVTRAYQELTAQGLLVTVPGSGTFVVEKIPELARPIPEVLADHEARIAE